MWLVVLSDQLPVGALVGRYPANKLIGRELNLGRRTHGTAFQHLLAKVLHMSALALLSKSYSPPEGRLPTHYSPVCHFTTVLLQLLVRLACVKRAASVRSEPGSNSQYGIEKLKLKGRHFNTPYSVVKERKLSLQETRSIRKKWAPSQAPNRIVFLIWRPKLVPRQVNARQDS